MQSGVLRTLRQLHSKEAIDLILARLSKAYEPQERLKWLDVLARLYYREGDYMNGNWWGTRPDNRGPYFDRQAWDQTERIKQVLVQAASSVKGDDASAFKAMLEKYQISLGKESEIAEMAPEEISRFKSLRQTQTIPIRSVTWR